MEVLDHLDKYEADVSNLKIVLTDGTSKMTGCKTGAVAVLERRLGHVVQRSGCMLHHMEKPYEHLHEYYDGVTTGPATFSGPIGNAIEGDVWKLEVGNFIPVLNPELLTVIRELPQEVRVNLSRDIKYALGIAEVVITGMINEWTRKKSGNIHQARWLSRQSRLLRVYIKCRAYFKLGLNAAIERKIQVHWTEKSSKKCIKWDISLKGTNVGSFQTISWSGDLGFFLDCCVETLFRIRFF